MATVEVTTEAAAVELRALIETCELTIARTREADRIAIEAADLGRDLAERCDRLAEAEGFMSPLVLRGLEKVSRLLGPHLPEPCEPAFLEDVDEIRELLAVALQRLGNQEASDAEVSR